jgi:hypothetical protein
MQSDGTWTTQHYQLTAHSTHPQATRHPVGHARDKRRREPPPPPTANQQGARQWDAPLPPQQPPATCNPNPKPQTPQNSQLAARNSATAADVPRITHCALHGVVLRSRCPLSVLVLVLGAARPQYCPPPNGHWAGDWEGGGDGWWLVVGGACVSMERARRRYIYLVYRTSHYTGATQGRP